MSGDYVFKAQSVSPGGGAYRHLTSIYTLQVSEDTLAADLPYFGRAYSAPINPSEGGIRFTSTEFELKKQSKKKGGWVVLLEPKDTRDVRQLTLTISEKGYALLQVTSNNRQPISFNGYIDKKKA